MKRLTTAFLALALLTGCTPDDWRKVERILKLENIDNEEGAKFAEAYLCNFEGGVTEAIALLELNRNEMRRFARHDLGGAPKDCAKVIRDYLDEASAEFGADPRLVREIVRCESSGRPWAINPERTSKGHAEGLGQHLEDYQQYRLDAIGEPDGDPLWGPTNARMTAWLVVAEGTDPYLESVGCWGRR